MTRRDPSAGRPRQLLPAGAAITALLLAPHAASAALDTGFSGTVTGGMAIEGWGVVSTSAEQSTTLTLKVPEGATITHAWLYTIYKDAKEPTVNGYPSGLGARVTLDGTSMSLAASNVAGSTIAFGYDWASYRWDVTDIAAARRASTAGDTLSFTLTEAGDMSGSDSAAKHTSLDGHALVIVYSHPDAPPRNVTVMNGSVFTTNNSAAPSLVAQLPLASPHDATVSEASVFAVSFQHELSCCENDNRILVDGATVSSTAGGADDGIDSSDWDALWTVGSFGGGTSPSIGSPVGLDGDVIDGAPTGRADDELYNLKSLLSSGATSFKFESWGASSDQMIGLATFQGPARCADGDDDGFWTCTLVDAAQDCDDGQPGVFPGSGAQCDSVEDTNCDGAADLDDTDGDGDGYTSCDGDCDDTDDTTWTGAEELPDGIDNNCDGTVDEGTELFDDDGDGASEVDGDCDDSDPNTFPGAGEDPDGTDNDCDGTVDEGTTSYDDDGDTWTETEGDCDDADAAVYPDAPETCGDGVDQDCQGGDTSCLDVDHDQDGFTENGGDCDDGDPDIHPDAAEVCDGIDNNCNVVIDDVDADNDGAIDAGCGGTDCDDGDPSVGGEEVPDGIDNDCDGEIDEGFGTPTPEPTEPPPTPAEPTAEPTQGEGTPRPDTPTAPDPTQTPGEGTPRPETPTQAPTTPTHGEVTPRPETPTAQEPTTPPSEPTPTAQEPTPTAQEPTPTAQEPTPTAQEPTPTAQEPTPTSEEPTEVPTDPAYSPTPEASPTTDPNASGGGCNCSTPASSPEGAASLGAMVLLVGLLRRRTRR